MSPADIEKGLELFQNKEGDTVVSVKDSSDSMFFNSVPPTKEVIKARLLNNAIPSSGGINYDTFSKSSDDYRVWTSKNKLVTPEYEVPKDDGVKGGYYAGGEPSYKAFVVKHEQALAGAPTEEPSMKDKMQQAPGAPAQPVAEQAEEEQPSEETPEQPVGTPEVKKPVNPVNPGFVPVDEQEKLHETNKRKEKGIKGPEDMPSGQVPEMARMSGDTMKIKRMARRVLAMYLSKDAAVTGVSRSTSPVTPATRSRKNPSIPVSNIPEENAQSAVILQNLAKNQKATEEKIQQTQQGIIQRAQRATR
jgi:hypothetical protein